MYSDFVSWLTDLDAFKLGMTFGTCLGILLIFIITAVVSYAVDLFNKTRKHDDKS